eukprot:12534902-Heterocapsa_arctica.AAC.1
MSAARDALESATVGGVCLAARVPKAVSPGAAQAERARSGGDTAGDVEETAQVDSEVLDLGRRSGLST